MQTASACRYSLNGFDAWFDKVDSFMTGYSVSLLRFSYLACGE